MTHSTQPPTTYTSKVLKKVTPHFLEVEAKLAASGRQAGHEYVPMDVFIDARTMKEHFQVSSILAR